MKDWNGIEGNQSINQFDDEIFLRGIYRKVTVLEYEQRENERVLANRRRLRRQWLIRLGVTTGAVIGLIYIMQINSFDMIAVLPLSSVLITLGLLLEHIELRMTANKE
ncbi:hypothetical protein [Paenibacillus sp. GXUN7292]|uniref:hypothetical protein n=1 Tax=Paenibacillus sp. GXUN7292 TaxID=3422499 RepID=UPI003D7CF6B4